MGRTPFSALARGVDPRIPSNRHALTVAAAAAAAGALAGWMVGDGPEGTIRSAFAWAMTSFLAWVTARELDHDDPRGALIAALVAPAALAWVGTDTQPLLLASVALAVAARLAVRSTGLPPRAVDLAAVGVGGVVVAATPAGWAAALVLAVALVRDAGRGVDPVPAARWVGFGLAVAATARLGLAGGYPLPPIDVGTAVPAVAVAAVAVLCVFLADRRPPVRACDHTSTPPRPADQWVARLLTGVGAAVATVLALDPIAVVPVVAALVGIALVDRLRPPPD